MAIPFHKWMKVNPDTDKVGIWQYTGDVKNGKNSGSYFSNDAGRTWYDLNEPGKPLHSGQVMESLRRDIMDIMKDITEHLRKNGK